MTSADIMECSELVRALASALRSDDHALRVAAASAYIHMIGASRVTRDLACVHFPMAEVHAVVIKTTPRDDTWDELRLVEFRRLTLKITIELCRSSRAMLRTLVESLEGSHIIRDLEEYLAVVEDPVTRDYAVTVLCLLGAARPLGV
jgi:hypothetical protein